MGCDDSPLLQRLWQFCYWSTARISNYIQYLNANVRSQAIIWANDAVLLIEPLRTNSSAICIKIHKFWYKKMHSKMSFANWWSFNFGVNVWNVTTAVTEDLEYVSEPTFGYITLGCRFAWWNIPNYGALVFIHGAILKHQPISLIHTGKTLCVCIFCRDKVQVHV